MKIFVRVVFYLGLFSCITIFKSLFMIALDGIGEVIKREIFDRKLMYNLGLIAFLEEKEGKKDIN